MNLDELVAQSAAIFRGTTADTESFQPRVDGAIWTRALLRVDQSFKGVFPKYVKLVHAGGQLGNVAQADDASPQFKLRKEYLVFVSRRADGTLFSTQGSSTAVRLDRDAKGRLLPASQALVDAVLARTQGGTLGGQDVTDQGQSLAPSPNVLLVDGGGVPARFTAPDRGEHIPYIVDMQALPAGISQAQALAAVSNACAVWSAASSARFVFVRTQNLGTASVNINTNDGVFRIQLHDLYNFITETNVLGKGGRSFNIPLLPTVNWGSGGNVAGQEFHQGRCGYVVLEHGNASLQNLATFTEVLCHEIGHALGLAHTSENSSEADPLLNQAIMYYQAHADGRGARLNSNDTNSIRQAYPLLNTPPYSYDRVMDITTHFNGFTPTVPAVPGINEIELRGYDLQTTSLSIATANADASGGSFTLAGSLLKFAPNNYYSDPRIDPATSAYWDIIYARFGDGTNFSPYIMVRTLSFNDDSSPTAASDGIPDAWMQTYFGNINPASGPNRGANADFDGDKLSNLNEYRAGMDPTLTNSTQRITVLNSTNLQWQAKAYELYEVLGSTNLTTWTRYGNPAMPTSPTGSMSLSLTNAGRQFFRILKVP